MDKKVNESIKKVDVKFLAMIVVAVVLFCAQLEWHDNRDIGLIIFGVGFVLMLVVMGLAEKKMKNTLVIKARELGLEDSYIFHGHGKSVVIDATSQKILLGYILNPAEVSLVPMSKMGEMRVDDGAKSPKDQRTCSVVVKMSINGKNEKFATFQNRRLTSVRNPVVQQAVAKAQNIVNLVENAKNLGA